MPENHEVEKSDIGAVLAEFDGKKELLKQFCEKTKALIEEFLQDQMIRYQSVQARVKTADKLKDKYLDQKKNYKRLSDITDQVALRIVTYYEDEVDHVADVIRREFAVDLASSVDKRDTEPDKFGYYALNYVCRYSDSRTSQVEYKRFKEQSCEIQITSILRHAWSEIEHPWYDLRDAFPRDIKRRFARMAALLEIAESEFLSLRNAQANYRKAVSIQVESNLPNVQLDAVSLRSFLERDPLVAELDRTVARILEHTLVDDLSDHLVESRLRHVSLAGIATINDLRELLKDFKAAIPEFARRCKDDVWPPATPSTFIPKGVCTYQLSLILVSARGEEETVAFFNTLHILPRNVDRQVAIAKEIVGKYRLRTQV